jgi:hypothetical protein
VLAVADDCEHGEDKGHDYIGIGIAVVTLSCQLHR